MAIVFLEVLHLLVLGEVINVALSNAVSKNELQNVQRTPKRPTTTHGNQTNHGLRYTDYDSSYYDYDESSYDGSELNVTEKVLQGVLRKCHCAAHEILLRGSETNCSQYETFVEVQHLHETHVFNTSHFGSIQVEELICDEGFFKYELPPNNFILEPTRDGMKLYDYSLQETFSIASYCIDHIVDSLGNLKWEAWVCLPRAPLHLCCPEGHILNAIGDCMSQFIQPTVLPDAALDMGQFGKSLQFDVPCFKGLTEIDLGSETSQLIYSVHQAPMLHYTNTNGYSHVFSSYCIGYRKVEGSFRYYARFCELHKCCHDEQYLDNGYCYVEDDMNKTDPHSLLDQAINDCSSQHAHPSDAFQLQPDGRLFVPSYQDICHTTSNTNDGFFDIDRYCVHESLENEKRVQIAIVCLDDSQETLCENRGLILSRVAALVICMVLQLLVVASHLL